MKSVIILVISSILVMAVSCGSAKDAAQNSPTSCSMDLYYSSKQVVAGADWTQLTYTTTLGACKGFVLDTSGRSYLKSSVDGSTLPGYVKVISIGKDRNVMLADHAQPLSSGKSSFDTYFDRTVNANTVWVMPWNDSDSADVVKMYVMVPANSQASDYPATANITVNIDTANP